MPTDPAPGTWLSKGAAYRMARARRGGAVAACRATAAPRARGPAAPMGG